MIVGTLRMRLFLRDCHTLKEKRSVIRGLKEHLTSKFSLSVAEVDHHDVWQSAELGAAVVGVETAHVREVLEKVVNYVRFYGGVQLSDHEIDAFGD